MKKLIIVLLFGLSAFHFCAAQTNSMSIGTTTTKDKAILWLKNSGGQGLILPSVTTSERTSMGLNNSDEKGMIVFDNNLNQVFYWNGLDWLSVSGGGGGTVGGSGIEITGNTIKLGGTGSANISALSPSGVPGQLLMWNGTTWVVTASSGAAPALNQVLTWNGTNWAPQSLGTGGTVTSVTGTAPVSVATGTSTPVISMTQATATTDGYLGKTDFSTFSGKVSLGGDLGGTATSPLVSKIQGVSVSPNAPTNLQVLQYNGTAWAPASLSAVGGTVTNVTGTAPISVLTGTTTPVISIAQASATNSGFLSSTDHTLFSGKVSLGGDLGGTASTPLVTKIQGVSVSPNAPTNLQVLQYNGTAWAPTTLATGSGSVTSVGLSLPSIFTVTNSPVTTTGTLTGTLASQTANTIFAAPNGSAGAPTFRSIVAADLPTTTVAKGGTGLTTAPTNGQLLMGNGTGYTLSTITQGTGINITNGAGTITVAANAGINANQLVQLDGTGKLPAVDGSQLINIPAGTVADGSITGGTAGAGVKIAANTITGANLATNIAISTTGNISVNSPGIISGAGSGITGINASNISSGTLPVANGGTGAATLTGVVVGAGTTAMTGVVHSGPNQYLRRNSANTGYEFGDLTLATGDIVDGTILNADVSATAAIAGTKITPAFGTQNISTTGTLSSGAITATNLASINTVPYSWPNVQGVASTVLTNNGTGTLTWTPATSGWSLVGNAGINPAINFIGTTDAQDFRIRSNNLERLTVTSAGLVGIGSTAPTAALGVTRAGLATASFAGTNHISHFNFSTSEETNIRGGLTGAKVYLNDTHNGDVIIAAGGGNTGIGTTTPSQPLSVIGQIGWGGTDGGLNRLQTDQGGSIELGGNNSTANPLTSGGPYFDFHYGTGAAEDFNMRISNTGDRILSFVDKSTVSVMTLNNLNVGIGTITPVSKLDVAGDVHLAQGAAPGTVTDKLYNVSGNLFWNGTNISSGGSGWSLTGNSGINPATNFIGTTDNNALVFKVNNTKAGKIDINHDTYFGFESGANFALVSLTNNTAYGYQSLFANTNGIDNTAVGSRALAANTFGGSNVAVGSSALQSNTQGIQNTTIGATALANSTIGNYNTAIGAQALVSNVAGAQSTAIGSGAMQNANSSGTFFNTFNTAVGYEALRGSATASANTGTQNTAVGHQSLLNNTTGFANVAVGVQSLNSNTSGNFNTAVGLQALQVNTSGINNASFGKESLKSNTTGTNNNGFGLWSLYSNTTGGNNVGIGTNALYTNTTGFNNTAIGQNSDVASGNLSNSTAIGTYAYVAASNSLVLGGINGVNGATNNTNVGIGTTTPGERLDINGAILLEQITAPSTTTDRLYNVGGTLTWNGASLTGGYGAGNGLTVNGSNLDLGNQAMSGASFRGTSNLIFDMMSSASAQNTKAGFNFRMFDGLVGTQYELYARKSTSTPAATDPSSDLLLTKEFSTAGGNIEFLKIDNSTNNLVLNGAKTYSGSYGNVLIPNGKVGIGTTSPIADFVVSKQNARTDAGIFSYSSTATHAPNFYLIRSRGTETTPTAVQNGDNMGTIGFIGETGSGISEPSASIDVTARENFTGSAQGTEMALRTIGIGEATPSDRLVINGTGDVKITGEVQRPATGAANLVPIAYAYISSGGGVVSGTGNVTASNPGTGTYNITVTSETISTSGYFGFVTPIGGSGFGVTSKIQVNAGSYQVFFRDISGGGGGSATNSDFYIVIYKL